MDEGSFNIVQSIKYFTEKLSEIYAPEEADSIAHYYFEHKLTLSKWQIYENRSTILQFELFENDLQRLMLFEPVQYVTGIAWFCDRKYFIEKGVLIPRPETEELILRIKDFVKFDNPRILDIGTGSGCIAITLKLLFPNSNITAIDLSKKALDLTKRNAEQLGAEITILHEDVFNLSDEIQKSKFDLIVSNPPYVRMIEKTQMNENVLNYEPEMALFVPDSDPLMFYKKIGEYSLTKLNSSGQLFFEINENFRDDICQLLKEQGYNNVHSFKDIHEKWRIVRAQK
ncbi:MAG: peptide chain release factor N(5)-glutamine methyltransferase [Bacteroidetes bacterium HGW-Bacteroidetes-21]|jgi:release factor glutamine methyltransferase|nr:MAG: peptide chain release factor N(5)-glutamine methyltransferase [Bacteroidetes bacterium HGW-Bacteroidetes-21]